MLKTVKLLIGLTTPADCPQRLDRDAAEGAHHVTLPFTRLSRLVSLDRYIEVAGLHHVQGETRMLKRFLAQPWLRHVAVAVSYAIGYALFRTVSFSHWSLFAGLQLAVLLLIPYEYWLALAVGEMTPLIYVAVQCANQFGLTWAVFKAVPSIVLVMPIVFACRTRLWIFDSRTKVINMTAFLLCGWIAALVVALYNTMLLSLAPRPPGYPPLHEWTLRYGLGHYLGILTVTPLILAFQEVVYGQSFRSLRARLAESRLLLDSTGILLPSLGLLVWIGWHAATGSDIRHIAQVAMFLPMVALALRHGWQGAAIGGSAASIAIVILMPSRYDHDTMQAQTFIAFAITTMLLVGTRVTGWNRRERQEKHDMRLALALAQRNYYAGERQLRQAAYTLLEIQTAGHRLLHRLMQLSPSEFGARDRQTRPLTQRTARLIEHYLPLSGADRTLPQALTKGSLAQALAQYGVPLRVQYHGAVSTLPYEFHLAIYRLICDCVTFLAEHDHLADIVIRLRCCTFHGQRWAILHVRGMIAKDESRAGASGELLWQLRQLSRGGGLRVIQDGAATFGGDARQRARGDRLCITALLREPT
ncbi:MASE1 domain-containing protein [Burkholderia pseudomallei]|uniref:MASE1 domain-containing protein n=1 Tax=Burkholderia pseudomallei TaxID=28450 RepID=UPI0012B164F3|nr:MASE1 domain-containing protein [Burkholderia pseudomallei]